MNAREEKVQSCVIYSFEYIYILFSLMTNHIRQNNTIKKIKKNTYEFTSLN